MATCSSESPVAGELGTGDAVRCTATGTGGQRVTATEAAEVLVWGVPATVTAWTIPLTRGRKTP